MSAITGIFLTDGRDVDSNLFKKMNDSLRHRGPDGSEIWVGGAVGLGHQMLHTTSESLHEKLPFKDDDSGLIITADARIDNRDELAPLLKLENSEKESDSFFILRSYQRWGDKCPEKLLGDFTFAIWDPAKEQLFCARDHMGIKPFYYYLSDQAFYFATEIKALLTILDVSCSINELKVAAHLMVGTFDRKLTFYENIFSLRAAHILKIDHKDVGIRKYWDLDPEKRIKMDSDEDYINAFREIFAEAVNCRLRSAFPIGFELSGGLDSSSIVCMAKKILTGNDSNFSYLNTFSYVLNDFPQIDERHYIEKVINTGGIIPTFIRGDNLSPLEEMETILWYLDQPFFTPNMAIFWKLYKKINEKDIRIVLNGEGGDNISAIGPNYFKELLVKLQWKKLIREIWGLSKRINKNFFQIFIIRVLFPLLPVNIKNCARLIFRKKNRSFILSNDLTNRLGGKEYLKKIIMGPIEAADTTRKYQYLHLIGTSTLSSNEERDRLSAAFSIETRFPFRDKRIVEFCYAVPNQIKFKFGWNRYLHRVAMKDIIPREIQWRTQKYLAGPLYHRNLLLFEKNYLEEIFNTNNRLLDGYVDSGVIKDIYQKYKSGSQSQDTILLWLVTIMHIWLQKRSILV